MAIRPLNSVAGFSVGETPANIILANGDITTTNITTTGVSNLNSVGNVKISGGSAGQVISTDGAGNLSFITIGTASLNNGTSNVTVLNNGNITFSVGGNANVVTITGTGANIAGYANITGNVDVGNLAGTQLFASANVVAPQFVSNISTGTAPLVVSSTTLVSNLNADLLDGYNTAVSNTADTVVVRDGNGNVSANYFIGDGSQLTGIDTSLISNGTSNVKVASSGNVTVSVAGNSNVVTFTGTGANITGYASVTGNVTAGNVYANSGTIGAQTLKGEGGNISNIQGANVSGTVSSATTSGTVTTNAQPNITSVGVLSNLTVADTVLADGYSARTGSDLTISVLGPNANVIITPLGTGITDFSGKGIGNIANANVTGNIEAGGVKTDNLYYANGTPWDLQQPAGSNTYVQYNDNGSFGASANFAFDDTTQLLTIAGASAQVNVGANTYISNSQIYLGNTDFANGGAYTQITDTYVSVQDGGVGPGSRYGAIDVGGISYSDDAYTFDVSNTGIYQSNTTLSTQFNVYANAAIRSLYGNGAALYMNSTEIAWDAEDGNSFVANAAGAYHSQKFQAPQLVSNVATGTAPIVVTSTTRVANLNVANAGVAETVSNAAQPNITSVGTLTSLGVTGNITAGNVAGGNLVSANYLSGTLTTAAQPNITSVGNLTSLDVTGNISSNNLSTTNKVTAGNGLQVTTGALSVLAGNLDVTGNINVTGNLNYSNVTDLVVGDPLIYIGANNTGDTYDLGIVGSYNEGTYQHTGIARNAADNYWTFFDGVAAEPTTVIDWANAIYPTVKMGNLITTANANIAGYANVVGNANVGNLGTAGVVVATGNVTGGNLTTGGALSVTGNANVGNIGAAAGAFTANVTAGNVYANSGTIGANVITGNTVGGTLTTAAQPNITSVGTLTSLDVTGNVSTGNVSANIANLTTANVSGNVIAGGVKTDNLYYANGTPWDLQEAAGANYQIQYNISNNFAASANFTYNDTSQVFTVNGTANVTTANVSGQLNLGNSSVNTGVSWASVTTSSITANQTIASFSTTGITGVEFLVKGVDSTGSKYSVATVQAVTDGTSVDYSTFGGVSLGGYTGSLAVNIVGGQIRLQVTPASSNSTVWTTQYRLI